MRTSKKFISLFAGMALVPCVALADLVVIVNPANADAVDSQLVKRIFLGKEKKFPSGTEAKPLNQSSDATSRGTFDEQVLGRNSSQIAAYWSKLVFTGKGVPPKEVGDDAAAVAAVAADPAAISYVDRAAVTDQVKVISL